MANKTLPKVQLTSAFRTFIEQSGLPGDDYANYFAEWKSLDAVGQLADPYFGKDGPYQRPLRGGKVVLHHVHLRPQNNPADAMEWDRRTRAGSFKTSDSVLVYAQSMSYGYLLIHSVSDPGGHAFSNMSTAQDARLMEEFASIAEEFVFWGKVA